MKKTSQNKIATRGFWVFLAFMMPGVARAQDTGTDVTFENPLSGISNVRTFVSELLDIIIQIAVPIIVIFIIYSGFLFVTARGDTTQIQKARTTFIAVIIGAVIILGAKVLASGIQGTIDALTF